MATQYHKGVNFEREIVHKFWNNGWAAMRAAGSGTIAVLVPDIIAIKNNDVIAVECKTTTNDRLSLKKDITQLLEFSGITGARTYIAIKFLREKPRFYKVEAFVLKNKYTISVKDAYLGFESLIGEQMML
ncbi:hypothetical protein BEH94_09270 [Candidatus Altiarchaeales archaeon WOR_SM1_SCG]|nr:hypothetical protein BEH94_09270 [Candidatus Altiarchaeales archaeon WOR_SM1_SCG]